MHLCCTVDQWIKAQHNSSQLDTHVDHISVSDSKKLQQNKKRQHQKTCTLGHLWPALTSSVVCPMMKCCCVDDTSLEHAIAGLSPGWVDPDVDGLYIRNSLPQPGGMWVQKVSSNDWAVRVTPQWPKALGSALATCPNKRNRLSGIRWETGIQPVGSLPVSSVGNVSGIQDPEDFTERPCVKSICPVT